MTAVTKDLILIELDGGQHSLFYKLMVNYVMKEKTILKSIIIFL